MNYLRKITNKIWKAEEQKEEQPVRKMSGLSSNSFEVIVSSIIDVPPSEDFILLDQIQQEKAEEEQQGIENMYIKDYLFIGKKCQGRALTIEEWKQIIINSDLSIYSKKDLYFSIFKGIDFLVRKDVWQVFSNTKEMKLMTALTFQDLTNEQLLPKGELEMINKDVVRTSAITKYLPQLKKILIAYSNLSKKGYTQGMNLIGAVLLKSLAIQNDLSLEGHAIIEEQFAERVFWVLVGVMYWKNWFELFQQNLSGLMRMLDILRQLMKQNVPKILQLIQSNEWDLGIFAQYYVTICLYHCPPQLSPIILDLFLLDGETVIHSLLIRMLSLNEATILGFKDESHLMRYLKTQMLQDTYQKLLKNRVNAKNLQDFQINFLKTFA